VNRASVTTRESFSLVQEFGAERAEVEAPDLSERIPDAGHLDAVPDRVGNRTTLVPMLRRRGRPAWLAGLAGRTGSLEAFNFVFAPPGLPPSDVSRRDVAARSPRAA
jgi:hypothetical protein